VRYLAIDSAPEIFRRMIDGQEFDVAEMSASTFLSERAKGAFPFVAIPVFPPRVFRHGYIFINKNSGISAPSDLTGKRIGVEGYKQTAAVWIRGLLADEYRVDLSRVTWFQGALEAGETAHRVKAPNGVKLEYIPETECLSRMLEVGEIDALIGPRVPSKLGQMQNVARLFENYRAVEKDYYARTGIFPIMHTIVMRESLHQQEPTLGRRLYDALDEAKNRALQQMRFSGAMRYMLPWLYSDIEEINDIFGGDPWPYGVTANEATLRALAKYLFEQRLVDIHPMERDVHTKRLKEVLAL
jgi:4,5-dihydroxyphthalate decarboxylase